MGEFRMPSLGADMETGTLVAWKVKPGDQVKRGDIVADVETQKGVIEVEIFQDGTVEELLVPTGTQVPVGTVIATVRGPNEAPTKKRAVELAPPTAPPVTDAAAVPPPTPIAAAGAHAAPSPQVVVPAHRPRVSPAARKRAEVLHVALESVVGTGPQGAITSEDVERAATKKPAAAPSGFEGMRAAIAAAMSRSKREIPHYYLSTRIDVTRLSSWLEAENAKRPVTERLLMVVPLLKAVARALTKSPSLNGQFVEGRFVAAQNVNLGVAVSLRGGGLVAPAIPHTESLSLAELMTAVSDVILRTRAGTLRSSELTTGTATVTNLPEPGVETVFGVINPPQVAMIGLGRVVEEPGYVNGALQPRKRVTATLAADHRVSDGHDGGRFLGELERLLQLPEEL